MSSDYVSEVLLPQLKRYAEIDYSLIRRGYYPKGGGEVDIKIKGIYSRDEFPRAPPIVLVDQGSLIQIKGVSSASVDLQYSEVAERMARAARQKLAAKYDCPINITTSYQQTLSPGCSITLYAVFSKDEQELDLLNPIRLGADSLGEKGKRAEIVGQECADLLIKEIDSGAPVDVHLADNLIPYLALFGGKIRCSSITNHTLTNIYVCEQFTGSKFVVDKERNIISVKNY